MTWIVLLALIWPALWLIRLLFTVKILLGLEFRRETVAPHGPAGISAHLREAAQPCIAELEALGFELLGGWRCHRSENGALDEFAIVLNRPGTPVRAIVRARGEADRAGECWISLRTSTARGTEVVTASYAPEELLPLPPGILSEAMSDATAAALLERHTARIGEVAADAWVCPDLAAAALREQYLCDGVFGFFRASTWASERAGGTVSLRVGAAFTQARQLLRRATQQKKEERKRSAGLRPTPALSAESQLAIDLQHYRQMGAVMNGRMSRRAKAVVGAVSFLLFSGVLGWLYSPVVAVTLVVALVVHEGGHLLGMWMFGYRDTQLLFIPFFGGAAIGHDEKVLSPWKHIVIILLGPLPGLIAGLAALGYGVDEGAEWMKQAAATAVFLNAFNLLPILPLDGGQIVDFGFASRFSRARVLFVGASAVALLAMAAFLEGVQLLFVAGAVTLLRIPLEWRLAKLRREVRRAYPEGGDEEAIVRRLLAAMRAPAWAKVPALQRLQHVRGLQLGLRMPRPGFGTLCFAVAGYLAPLWLGGPVALWAARQKSAELVTAAEQSVREAGLDRKPARVQATVPDDENAAVLYAQADALVKGAAQRAGGRAIDAEVVALLRAAAGRRAFVPVGGAEEKKYERFQRGLALRYLITEAEERLKFREPEAAGALALDALRLARLFDSAPGWWGWQNHQQLTMAAWAAVEEVFAASPAPTAEFLQEVRRLADEEHALDFAAAALPHDLLQQAEWMGGRFDAAGEEGEWLGWMLAAQALLADPLRMRAETLTRAVELDRQMKKIRAGHWPQFEAGAPDGLQYQTMQVANLLARLRQAKVAAAIAEARKGGATVSSLDALDGRFERITHPFTRGAVQWMRRGNMDVITFAAVGQKDDVLGLGSAELTWRLPAQ